MKVEGGERGRHEVRMQRAPIALRVYSRHLLQGAHPAWPIAAGGDSGCAHSPRGHEHAGGGGDRGRAASFRRTRPPSAARCGDCCCCSNCSGCCCGCGCCCCCCCSARRRVRVVAAAADFVAATARRPLACGSRRVSGRPADPGPARLRPRPAPPRPRPAGPTPRPRVTPRPRPPAVDKSGLAGRSPRPLPQRGGFPCSLGGAGPGPGRHRTAGHIH